MIRGLIDALHQLRGGLLQEAIALRAAPPHRRIEEGQTSREGGGRGRRQVCLRLGRR
jgi:hypothetical protein